MGVHGFHLKEALLHCNWACEPLLPRRRHGVPKFLFDLKERTRFPRKLHLVENNLDQLTKQFRFKLANKLSEHVLFAGHRFGTDEIRAGDLAPILLQPQLLIGSLAAKPESQGRNLAGSEVNIDAVQVMGQDQPW